MPEAPAPNLATQAGARATASAAGVTPLLSVRDLRVEYLTPGGGSVCAVDHVSFDLAPGEVFGLAGESGSGKSTIAQAILRILGPPGVITAGEVLYRGNDILSLPEDQLRQVRWRHISLVFQSAMNSLNPVLSIGAQLMDAILAHEALNKAAARERAAELIRLVGIEEKRLNSYPHELSGGMRQRAVIAMALALKPQLLMMDEPTTALDVVVQREILQQVRELKQQLDFGILFITHDLSLMVEFCDRIAILYAGRVAEVAPAHELFDNPKHPYTQGLISSFPAVRGPRRTLEGIPGSPPNLKALPSGCPFHPRCDHALAVCSQQVPRLEPLTTTQTASTRSAACHLLTVEESDAATD